jgi:hypothetical protein
VNGGLLVQHNGSAPIGSFTYSGNRYYTTNSTSYPGQGLAPGGTFAQVNYPPDVDQSTIEGYMASLGMTPTLEAFLLKARTMSKDNFDQRFTPAAVRAFIKGKFGR